MAFFRRSPRKDSRPSGQNAVLPDQPKRAGRETEGGVTDRQIEEYLAATELRKQCLVEDGVILAIEEVNRKLLNGLTSLMEQQGITPEIRWVSPIDFQRRISDRERSARSGSRQTETARSGNVTVDYVLGAAVDRNASDIYIDIRRTRAQISFRIWGQVVPFETLDVEIAEAVCRGMFGRASSAQWQKSSPCEASFDYIHRGDRLYRVRTNSLPETRGQTLSCRLRDPAYVLSLENAGYSSRQISLIRRIGRSPGGLFIVSGETNSGKSTTLAGLMLHAPRGERMVEIADPVEVEFPHCTHVEIDRFREDSEANFRAILAATVRQNPDSLVLGEIRDEASARAAESMAIQGKRVLSTLHTQSCVAAIPRLINLGVDPHLLSLREFTAGIINQNLVPVVCRSCGLRTHPDPEEQRRYEELFERSDQLRFVNPNGCDACVAGVAGQTLVAEVYPLYLDRKDAHQLIASRELWLLEQYMISEWGIQTKQMHAREKVLDGRIDPELTENIIGEWTPPGRSRSAEIVTLPGVDA